MIALLSGAWWLQKLSGIAAQAVAIVTVAVIIFVGLGLGFWWLREDARQEERAKMATQMANARVQQLLLRQRAEKQATAIGARAEKDLLQELDVSEGIINGLEKKLADHQCNPQGRVICFPRKVAQELNK
jgi:hypothetical protein